MPVLLEYYLCGAFLFAVDAAAVFLSIQSGLAVLFHTYVPACSPILVEKRDAMLFRDSLTDLLEQIMLLKAAVEEGGGECIEPFGLGQTSGLCQSEMEADAAPLSFSIHHFPQPFFQSVGAVFFQSRNLALLGIDSECIKSAQIFRIRVDIGIEEERGDLVSLRSELRVRVNETRSATGVE